jgi:hypothetical protein
MRTTIDIPDETYRKVKVIAAERGTTVRELVLLGIHKELAAAQERPVRKLKLPLIHSSRPGTLELTNEQIDELTAFS